MTTSGYLGVDVVAITQMFHQAFTVHLFQPICCSYHSANGDVIQRCFVFETEMYGEGTCQSAFIEGEGGAVPDEVRVWAVCSADCGGGG